MTEDRNKDDNGAGELHENIFHIVDRIVENVDKTKKLVLIMVLAIIISIPLSFHITAVLIGPPYSFGFARVMIPFLVILAFAIVGIRQWLILLKWTKKYKAYKELQKKIDEKFDFDLQNNNAEGEEKTNSK